MGHDRTKAALEAFRRVHELDAAHPDLKFHHASALLSAGNVDEGVDLMNKALEDNPEDHRVFYRIGHLRVEQGLDGEATRMLEQAVRLKPDEPALRNELGESFARMAKTSSYGITDRLAAR